MTPKLRCRNDCAVFNWRTKNWHNFPEDIRLLTDRHLVFHFGAMNIAPIQCAMTEVEKLRSPLTSKSVVQRSFCMFRARKFTALSLFIFLSISQEIKRNQPHRSNWKLNTTRRNENLPISKQPSSCWAILQAGRNIVRRFGWSIMADTVVKKPGESEFLWNFCLNINNHVKFNCGFYM